MFSRIFIATMLLSRTQHADTKDAATTHTGPE